MANAYRSAKLLFTLTAVSAALFGCSAAQLEQVHGMLGDTPKGAQPGYHMNRLGDDHLRKGEFGFAADYYCRAAELGHKEGAQMCSKVTVLANSQSAAKSYAKNGASASTVIETKKICAQAKYGNPAKEVCEKLNAADNQGRVKILTDIYNKVAAKLNRLAQTAPGARPAASMRQEYLAALKAAEAARRAKEQEQRSINFSKDSLDSQMDEF